ncbi:MAG: HEAT repeat domain-containing protein [Woeseiaceae bacterium]|nr:HEAT repeat domain-containing protein [Woeseiaceae bacterium]
MKTRKLLFIAVIATLTLGVARAQDAVSDAEDPNDVLKIAALEALIAAPPERALPLATKVLDAENTSEVKEAALFVLSQIEMPEARNKLLEVARSGDPELSAEAVRMIGINGDPEAMAGLGALYSDGDEDLRNAVLEAYLIAGDAAAVYAIASNAANASEFEAAVEMLGAMGATAELRSLSETSGYTEELIQALGIAGGDDVNQTLMEIYRGAETDDIREAALEGMLISGYDEGVLELYRESTDINEKRDLLQMLAIMNSDLVLEVIDAALEGGL